MNNSLASVNIKQTTIKPYSKKKLEFSTLFINLSTNVDTSLELIFKYSQIKDQNIEPNLHNAIKAYFDNGGKILYILNYSLENFDLKFFMEYIKKACDNLLDIEVIATPTLLQSNLELKECVRVLALVAEYSSESNRLFVMDINEDIKNEYLDMLGEGVIYYPWFKNKLGELVAPSSVATGIMSKNADQDIFFHSIANKKIESLKYLDFELEKDEASKLLKEGINPILFMHNDGLKIWGVNAFNSKFKTINEVRVIKYIKKNLKELMRNDLFEINSAKLKDKIYSKTNHFLYGLWQMGALAGESKDEAYLIDANFETDKGEDNKLEFYISVALSKPLEFINIKLERIQKDGMMENISLEA